MYRNISKFYPSRTKHFAHKYAFSQPIVIKYFYSNLKGNRHESESNKEMSSANKLDTKSITNTVKSLVKSAVDGTIDVIKNPKQTWISIKDAISHYWLGSKLLWSEIKLTIQILRRVLGGHLMTRRERIQLIRTTNDLFRLVPFAVFVIVPFMEFLLPFALRLFPNMLPSTFQDSLKKEETMKKELQMRLALAGFLQDALKEMVANNKRNDGGEKSGAKEVINFIERARLGEQLPNESVIRIAQFFKDELTLDNIGRPQLVSLCQYMGLRPYGGDVFLRFQIRNKIRAIKEDDRRILWEGIDSLTVEELRDACQERGMRSVGLTHFGYKRQLQDWLDLSTQKNIPVSLLIMSRAFNLTSTKIFEPEDVLRSSLSSLTDDTINEVVIAAASADEVDSADIRKRKLDSLQFQTELIEDEREKHEFRNQKMAVKVSDQVVDNSTIEHTQKDTEDHIDKHANEDEKQMLTFHEMEAIGDLARGSSVVREKAELAKLEAHIETVNIAKDQNVTSSVVTSETVSKPKKLNQDELEAKNLYSVLNSMVEKLKKQIDTTEKELGDKLNILDKDGDGELSSVELKEAILKILKRVSSDKEAEEIVRILDKDKDGRVSVVELLQFAESLKLKAEVDNIANQTRVP